MAPTAQTRESGMIPKHSSRFAGLRENDEAAAGLAGVGAGALTIATVVVGAVVALIIIANLFPSYSGAVGGLAENMTTADWGDPVANNISPVFAMLVSLGGLFAIVGLAFLAYKLRRGG